MGWPRRIALFLVAILVASVLPPASRPAASQTATAPIVRPCEVDPHTGLAAPFPKVPRSKMPPAFAPDALSHLGAIFGPQRYGASFGDPIDVRSGAYTLSATDLSVHGRGRGFTFTRTYNSADDWYEPDGSSFVGPGWTHSYLWEITDAAYGGSGCFAYLRKGDGTRDRIGTGTDPTPWFPTSADYAACTFAGGITTLTMRDQSRYLFGNRFDTRDPDGGSISTLYQLLRIELPSGDRTTLAYATSPLGTSRLPVLAAVSDTVGRTYALSYDASARLRALSDPTGRAVSFDRDGSGRLVAAADATGAVTRYAYDGTTRHILTTTDPDGRVRATSAYDFNGQVTQQTDGEGFVTTRAQASCSEVDVTDPRGTRTRYWFLNCSDLRLFTETVMLATSYTTSYEYDAYSNRSAIIDRLGNRTDLSYEPRARGNLLSRADPAVGGVRPTTSYQYDAKNNLIRVSDPRGFTTERSYDAATNVLVSERRQIDATGYATTTYAYGDPANPGLPTTITSPRGSPTALAYDASGNLVRKTDPDGYTTTYGYDALGRQTSVTDAEGHTTTTAYDASDRVASVTDPLLHATRYGYDGGGNKTSLTDRNGNVTTYVYDRSARLASVRQSPSPGITYTTSLSRDGNGNVTRVSAGNGNLRDSAYDAFDKVTSTAEYTSAGTLTTTYSRDVMGNVLARATPDGVTISYSYDALYRLSSLSAPGVAISYAYDLSGNRTQMGDATGTTSYSYDGAGRLTAVNAPAGSLTYAYDPDGDRTAVSYPGAGTVSYAYTAAGRLATVTDWAGRQSSYAYRPTGLVSSVTYPGGMVASYGYDAAGRLTQLSNASGATTLTSHAYTLDPEGNRTALAEFVAGITAPGATDTTSYGYDGLNRLSGASGAVSESFSFDGASNLTARSGPAAAFSYDAADRLQSDGARSYGWSSADQLTARGADTFAYDPLDRLTSATVSGTTTTYAYAGDGLLASRSGTAYLWDRSQDPAPILQLGADRIVHGAAGPLYLVRADGTTRSLARDGLGSVRAEVDGAGSVTRSARYAAYGAVVASSGTAATNLGFAGEIADANGLIYLRARWYDPATGRLLTVDPSSPNAARPISLNRFAYANGSPVVVTDPTGRLPGDPDDICILRGCGGGGTGGSGGGGAVGTLGRGGAAPVLQGQAGVTTIAADLEAQGYTIMGHEVTLVTPGGRVRVDLVARDPAGELHYIEVKNGINAELTLNQRANYPYVASGDAIAVGKNAALAGLNVRGPIPAGTLEIAWVLP